MIKRILCPTDFSDVAINGMEYASQLAQALNAHLTLINIVRVSIGEGISLFAGSERESVKRGKSSHELMNDYCKEINTAYGITCDQLVMPAIGSIEQKVAEAGKDYDLIVMGTNGVNELFPFYFGTNSYHVAKKVGTPVLIVPSECTFKPYNLIFFASDYNSNDVPVLVQLNHLINKFNSKVKVIHVSKKNSDLSQQMYRSFKNIMEEELGPDKELSFQRVLSSDIQIGLENIIDKENGDLLIICLEKHNIFYKLVHENLVKRLIDVSEIPILVMHLL